jgi:hypothetical protein
MPSSRGPYAVAGTSGCAAAPVSSTAQHRQACSGIRRRASAGSPGNPHPCPRPYPFGDRGLGVAVVGPLPFTAGGHEPGELP